MELTPMTMSGAEVNEIARLCHEVNRAYCQAIGDHSQLPWADTPEDIKNSARDGVVVTLANPNIAPEESHANWCRYKFNTGWRQGTVKDLIAKTHPALVAYAVLPQDQRVKDYLFGACVRTAMEMIGEGREDVRASVGETGGDMPEEVPEGTPPRGFNASPSLTLEEQVARTSRTRQDMEAPRG